MSAFEMSEIIGDSYIEGDNLGMSLQSENEELGHSNCMGISVLNTSEGLLVPQNLGQSLNLDTSCVDEYELGVSLQMDLSDSSCADMDLKEPYHGLITSTPVKTMDAELLGRVYATPKLPRSLESHMAGMYMFS